MCILKTIRCLVIAANEQFTETAHKLLHAYNKKDNLVDYTKTVCEALEYLKAKEYDLILMDLHTIDYDDFNLLLNKDDLTVSVIIITENRIYDEVFRKTYQNGFLVLPRPVTVNTFLQACEIGLHSSEKRKQIADKKKLHDIAFQDVAKILLVLHERMDEENAHRYVEKLSMDLRVAKQKSAEYVIGRYIKY